MLKMHVELNFPVRNGIWQTSYGVRKKNIDVVVEADVLVKDLDNMFMPKVRRQQTSITS